MRRGEDAGGDVKLRSEDPARWFSEVDLAALLNSPGYEWPDGEHPIATDGDLEIARVESLKRAQIWIGEEGEECDSPNSESAT